MSKTVKQESAESKTYNVPAELNSSIITEALRLGTKPGHVFRHWLKIGIAQDPHPEALKP